MPARAKKKGVMNMKKKKRCFLAAIFGKLLRKRSGASQMNALPPGDDFADIPPEYLEEELPF